MPDRYGRQDPEPVRKMRIAEVAKDVMGGYNHNLTNPALMSVNGHDTEVGYEFFVERDGRTFRFTVELVD